MYDRVACLVAPAVFVTMIVLNLVSLPQTMAPELDLIEDEDRLTHLDITLETEGLNAQVGGSDNAAMEQQGTANAQSCCAQMKLPRKGCRLD